MRKKMKLLVAVFTAALAVSMLAGCATQANEPAKQEPAAEAVELQIFAANSLEKALPEVQVLYTEKHPEVTFADTQFKGSGDLVEELKGGATADLLITASAATMDTAVENTLVDETTRIDMFNNDLVLVTAEDADITISDLKDLEGSVVEKIALGEPNAVPAGKYALQSLESAGLVTYDTAEDKTVLNIMYAESIKNKMNDGADKVGTVAQYVSSGEATLGFVYSSDVYRYDGIKSVFTVPADTHKPIIYPGAQVAASEHADAAKAFLDFCLHDADAQAIFSQYGFELV
ncbi:MAG: molybdate ABC transporter substrate-binding protein [Eggerthellaceae bacterium]|nr:molybdate ABC transporter substrate-binding protein [Eggerthellaceae bacterium]